ncbi:MAG: hypothetical protein KC443_15190, partial [Anaerolineales bacterium]|nr:hypothetical protein [Anaerolineales bacterium]
MQAPKIDPRSYEEIVAETEALVQQLTSWQPGTEVDAGGALIRIFGRFAEIIKDRLNQVPEKSFLSFLNLIGADLTPAQSARVPLTFQLAANSPVDAYVPAGTQVAATLDENEEEEVVFETERDLLVTRAKLMQVYARAFDEVRDEDQVGHYTAVATGAVVETGEPDVPFPYFGGDEPMVHYLYIACDTLLGLKEPTDVTIQIAADNAQRLASYPLHYATWDKESDQWLTFEESRVRAAVVGNALHVTLADCPPLKASPVNGVEGGWLRVQLGLPMPPAKSDLPLEAIAINKPTAYKMPYEPFSNNQTGGRFYLGGETAFLRRGATVYLDITLERAGVTKDASLTFNYNAATGSSQAWRALTVEDGTNGFTQNGRIRIQIPADGSWNITSYQSWTSRWCRISCDGSYSTAPQIGSIQVSYAWDLPAIEQITVSLPANRPPWRVESGLTNGVPLDVSKDFYPFGEEPRFNDTFYFAYGHVLAESGILPGDEVGLDVTLTTAGTAGGTSTGSSNNGSVTLVWEFWNGRQWAALGRSSNESSLIGSSAYAFVDDTKALTIDQKAIRFKLPTSTTPNIVDGDEDYWLRVRIVDGNYGQGARYTTGTRMSVGDTEVPVYTLIEANFAPPILADITFDVSSRLTFALNACQSMNDFTFVDHTPANQTADTLFHPFAPTSDSEPTLYLGFDRPFANRSVTLYTQVNPPTPDQVLPDQYRDKQYNDPPQLVWEYVRESGWARLSVADETNALADSGTFSFTGPLHFAECEHFGHSLYWLRVRWTRGIFNIVPFGSRIRLNTMWAAQTTTYRNELLGSSNGEPNQKFQTVQIPIQANPILQVKETDLSEAELALLQAVEAVTLVQDEIAEREVAWVHWQEMPDLYGSAANDRHYTLDHLTGAVLFGDGTNGRIPPMGQNNIRFAKYQTGGGKSGNRDAETIVQLRSTFPYIDGVTNFEPATG